MYIHLTLDLHEIQIARFRFRKLKKCLKNFHLLDTSSVKLGPKIAKKFLSVSAIPEFDMYIKIYSMIFI